MSNSLSCLQLHRRRDQHFQQQIVGSLLDRIDINLDDPTDATSDDERAELRGVEAAVDATGGDQLVVTAFFGDTRFIDHNDAVGILDGGQAVGDDQRGATP